MPVVIDAKEVALRLALTILAGLVVGFNRGEHGRPAGMRTTVLVCLAASLSMLQANLLMNTVGKAHDSFVVLDLMRLPLGVLSGMGFIGAGTILRKGKLVTGITTAATLWFVTLLGFCFGGGQLWLGLSALALGCGILWGLKYVEGLMQRDERGTLTLTLRNGDLGETELRQKIAETHSTLIGWAIRYVREPEQREVTYELEWRSPPGQVTPPPIVEFLLRHPSVVALHWQPQGVSHESEPQQTKPTGTPIPISG